MEQQSEQMYAVVNATGERITYNIPDIIPVPEGWNIIGNIELNGWSLIGDPLFNVLAYKTGRNGLHTWAIGWEHPIADKRAESPGYGFDDGFFMRSAEYIPVAYVLGQLVGLQEVRMDRKKDPDVPDIAYVVDKQRFFRKPQWRFRGYKTWIPMEPSNEVDKVIKDLSTRAIRQRMFGPNFNINAVAWYHQPTATLLFKEDICDMYISSFRKAALMLAESDSVRVIILNNNNRDLIPHDCILLLALDSDPDNLLAINVLAKPRQMSWAKYIQILQATRIVMATPESMREPVYPIRVLNIATNTVDKL